MTAQRDPNSRLREVVAAVDCTYEALARDVRRIAAENGEILQTNKSAISHWVNGTRAPSGRVGQYLAEALSRRSGRT
ncbi:tetratricopeptide repeat protein, partial [Streptomyces sp. SID11233]|nr:tetratricopeptide repeat protein [Streptomyces sp. SID11233]